MNAVKCIAVDDEKLARERLVTIVKNAVDGCEVESFSGGNAAFEYAQNNHVDVAFLDIEMRGMNGIELAKKLKAHDPKINIIFVTGYSEYALESYALHASGYLQKPVTEEAVRNEISQLRYPIEYDNKEKGKIFAKCFGNFEVFCNDEPMKFERAKTKELFAYLIDRRGAAISVAEICSVLWEDDDDDKKVASYCRNLVADLTNTLKKYGHSEVFNKAKNAYSVAVDSICCDYYDYLADDANAVRAFCGEYMSQYPWGEYTLANMLEK